MRLIPIFLVVLVVGICWSVIVVMGTLEGWLRDPIAPSNDSQALKQALIREVDQNYNGNAALVLIENGAVVAEHFASVGETINRETLFQVASMSKWVTAWGVMVLVEDGKLDLDEPVSSYLTRWHLPETKFDNKGVTTRRLLSHTAGLTDGLGFLGFKPGTKIQRIEEALSAPNATKGPGVKIEVGNEPGSGFKYSGGGYLILQLLVEEVSGESFESFMQKRVFGPLNMTRSTYQIEDPLKIPNLAGSYNTDGTKATLYNFTATAAASLYTTPKDMTRFIQAHLTHENNSGSTPSPLSEKTLRLMRQPHGQQAGIDLWGLGTILYASNDHGDFVFGHDGQNDPAINTTTRLNPHNGDGIIILESGNTILATNLGSEWVFWQTGNVDVLTMAGAIDDMISIILPGWILIALCGLLVYWQTRSRRRDQTLESG